MLRVCVCVGGGGEGKGGGREGGERGTFVLTCVMTPS